jgi:hypothetical protein
LAASTKLSQAAFRLLYLSETSEAEESRLGGNESKCKREVKKESKVLTPY